MPGFPPKYAVVEIYTRRVVSIDGKVRQGECLRCGKCCFDIRGNPCEFLESGNTCRIQNMKPLICLLYPVPDGPRKAGCEGCGLWYEEER